MTKTLRVRIGKLQSFADESLNKYKVKFYSDFSQLKYVFAEIVTKTEIIQVDTNTDNNDINPLDAKLKILEDELNIIEESNKKFLAENENLKNQINDLNYKVLTPLMDLSLL